MRVASGVRVSKGNVVPFRPRRRLLADMDETDALRFGEEVVMRLANMPPGDRIAVVMNNGKPEMTQPLGSSYGAAVRDGRLIGVYSGRVCSRDVRDDVLAMQKGGK